MSAAQVIQVLDQTVDWYRTLGLQQETASQPSDLLILYDNRQTANQVIALAFDVARANANLLSTQPAAAQVSDESAISSQALQQLKIKLDSQGKTVQAELAARRLELAQLPKNQKVAAEAKLAELQGELDLLSTKQTILTSMSEFVTGSGTNPGGGANSALKAQIDAMAVAVPASGSGNTTPAASTAPVPTATSSRFGLWDLAANVFRLYEKIGTIESIDRRTTALQTTVKKISAPLLGQLKTLSARGDALAAEADSADSTTLNGVHDQLDLLSDQFKQTSELFIPLSRETLLLNQFRRNLVSWRDTVKSEYLAAWKTLGVRLALLLVVLGIVVGGAELWRRGVVNYIHDARRRYQLLLLRRIAFWSLVIVVIGVAFASELGSIVTFAGLITAGVAVAMQSVLVSIVGYFFLIGKYGIRVGDRVQIGTVSGEVIDLGLVRMYLMELSNDGLQEPTGRVVGFANSVVFQVSGGLFKQIPGVDFGWHDITLALPAGADYVAAKERLMAAVTDALKDYRPELLRQTQEIQRTTSLGSAGDAQPQVQLQFASAGVQAHIRYPVRLLHAAEMDERVSRELLGVISRLSDAPAAAPKPGPAR